MGVSWVAYEAIRSPEGRRRGRRGRGGGRKAKAKEGSAVKEI